LYVPISKRLQMIASYVQTGSVVADIGSDHAYLPVYLIQTGKASKAIAGEVNEGPFQSAQHTVEEYGVKDRVDVRKGDGLDVIRNDERLDAVVIAGMGGESIRGILERGRHHWNRIDRLILQPMNHADRLRHFLDQNGWDIVDETLIEEDGILYEGIVCVKGRSGTLDDWLCKVGPVLLRSRHPLLRKKAEEELASLNRAISGMEKAQFVDSKRMQELQTLRTKWQEVLASYDPSA
jgi:tRNA (adenine22-N1)-methyltransferase